MISLGYRKEWQLLAAKVIYDLCMWKERKGVMFFVYENKKLDRKIRKGGRDRVPWHDAAVFKALAACPPFVFAYVQSPYVLQSLIALLHSGQVVSPPNVVFPPLPSCVQAIRICSFLSWTVSFILLYYTYCTYLGNVIVCRSRQSEWSSFFFQKSNCMHHFSIAR